MFSCAEQVNGSLLGIFWGKASDERFVALVAFLLVLFVLGGLGGGGREGAGECGPEGEGLLIKAWFLLGICFHARRTGNGQNGAGVGEREVYTVYRSHKALSMLMEIRHHHGPASRQRQDHPIQGTEVL